MNRESSSDATRSLASSLYISHFLSTWNSRGFEFGSVLFLASMYSGTLLPMSIYALFRALAAILFSPKIGAYIDNAHRLHVVRISIVGQRTAVILSCGLFSIALLSKTERYDYSSLLIFVGLVALACIEKLSAIMNAVAIERDWVVVLAEDDDTTLQILNAQMRRIDLICKLLSPLGIALLHSWSVMSAVWVTLLVNTISVLVEYWFIAKVYQTVPALGKQNSTPEGLAETVNAFPPLPNTEGSVQFHCAPLRIWLRSISAPLIDYIGQAGFLPSLALSLLYLTVLSFSGQMITFLLATPSSKLTTGTIGLVRMIATLSELSSTYAAPNLMARIGPVRAGIWFLSWQAITLTPAVYLLWNGFVDLGQASLPLFLIALILSRFGLWSFDLCAQLIIQESILPSKRGTFSSVEASVQNFFELCAYAMTILFAEPHQFCYPALISLLAIYCSAMLYAKFVRDQRGHLLHMPSCLKGSRIGASSNYELLSTDPDSACNTAG